MKLHDILQREYTLAANDMRHKWLSRSAACFLGPNPAFYVRITWTCVLGQGKVNKLSLEGIAQLLQPRHLRNNPSVAFIPCELFCFTKLQPNSKNQNGFVPNDNLRDYVLWYERRNKNKTLSSLQPNRMLFISRWRDCTQSLIKSCTTMCNFVE